LQSLNFIVNVVRQLFVYDSTIDSNQWLPTAKRMHQPCYAPRA